MDSKGGVREVCNEANMERGARFDNAGALDTPDGELLDACSAEGIER